MGNRNGFGVYKYANGNVFNGFWRDNCKQGFGEMKYATGEVFRGNYLKDKKDGEGAYWQNGVPVRYGKWKGNKQVDNV
jgi:hypothetical protein